MKLRLNTLQDPFWEKHGIKTPGFDVEKMREETDRSPVWIHFGAGNIFRGFIAELQQRLLEEGEEKSGIIACDTFDYEIIDKIYKPYDNLTLLVGLKPDGTTEKEIIASVAYGIKADPSDEKEIGKLKELFRNPSLQMISFTITEKGYALADLSGEFFPAVKADLDGGPEKASHAMSIVTALLYERFCAGGYPVAVVSMDNCSHNGEKLKNSVLTVAEGWNKNGYVGDDFLAYLNNEEKVTFPWSMIDKITPRPAKEVEYMLTEAGVEEMEPVVTGRNTFIAPFVNAEIPQYLVIEDKFPNGRPRLEKAGVYMTDRDTVNNSERMKVTTCLNPLHTALAVYGCMLGYTHISEEMQDKELKALVEKIGFQEGMPVVVDPKILSPEDFIHEVIDKRLPNPFIPDTPQRIATDTSQKIPIRFGETIKSYVNDKELDARSLTYIPLAIAGWLRYLLGVDDNGEEMQVSSDPMLDELQTALKGIELGNTQSAEGKLNSILSNEVLFGTDLCKIGLGEKIEGMFKELIAGKGAVRKTLQKYLD